MAPDTKDNNSTIWIHLRALHLCLLFIIGGTVCGFWICFTEIQTLRQALDAEIAKRTLVEFGNPESLNIPLQDRKPEYRKGENITPPYQETEVIFTYQESVQHNKPGTVSAQVRQPQSPSNQNMALRYITHNKKLGKLFSR